MKGGWTTIKERELTGGKAESGIAQRIYTRLPDGSALDHNRIHDAIDRVIATEKNVDDPFRAKKRYLYQYRDAVRDREAALGRYELITSPVMYNGQSVMRDPTRKLSIAEAYRAKAPTVHQILTQAEQSCSEAKRRVSRAICGLEKETQRLVLIAHYICGADLKGISTVYSHNPYWAKEIRDMALEQIDCDEGEPDHESDTQRVRDLERLIDKWTDDEAGYRKFSGHDSLHLPLDDRVMLMGLV